MASNTFILPFRPAFDSNGLPVPGAKLNFYLTGTLTRTPAYSDPALTNELPNPVIANSAARFVEIFLDAAIVYRVVLTDENDVVLDESDPYTYGSLGTYVDLVNAQIINGDKTFGGTVTFTGATTHTGTLTATGATNTAAINASGKITTAASTATAAGLTLPHGVAPTTAVNGDIWTTATGVYARVSGATVGPMSTGGGTGVTDGDKGDVVISGAGSIYTIESDAVSYDKMQNVTVTDRLLGRSTAGAGNVEEIVCTEAGRALLDDPTIATQRTTLGLGTLATQSGTFSGTSSGTNTGDQASIVGITGTLAQFSTAVTDADLARTDASNTFTGDQAVNGRAYVSGRVRVTDNVLPASGTGVELGYTGTEGVLIAYDRSGETYKAMDYNALDHDFRVSNSITLTVDSGGVKPVTSTTASAANVYQASSGSALLRSTSSVRYKTNVQNMTDVRADKLMQLRPITYKSLATADEASWTYLGLLAEEVAAIEPRLVHWIPKPADYTLTVDAAWPKLADGTQLVPDAVQYDRLPVLMLSLIKRLSARMAAAGF